MLPTAHASPVGNAEMRPTEALARSRLDRGSGATLQQPCAPLSGGDACAPVLVGPGPPATSRLNASSDANSFHLMLISFVLSKSVIVRRRRRNALARPPIGSCF